MATSESQIIANRANAKKSTGARTAAGKVASSRNSLRHGLTAKQVVLPGESEEDFASLRNELHDSYAPANTAEAVLVNQIAEHTWRLQRARRMETKTWSMLMHDQTGDETVASALLDNHAGDLEKLRRYEITTERSYHRAIDQLRKLQKERRAEERRAAAAAPASPKPRSAEPAGNGFVSREHPSNSAARPRNGFVPQRPKDEPPGEAPPAAA